MRLRQLQIRRIEIPFQEAFKHSSEERSQTESVWVAAEDRDGLTGYGESCPRSYVTGENLASVRVFFNTYLESLLKEIDDIDSLITWIHTHRDAIDANPSAWCAIELALLDLLAKQSDVSVENLLGLKPLSGTFQYSAVIGDGSIEGFRNAFGRYAAIGITDFKIKISGSLVQDRTKLDFLEKQGNSKLRVRLDANNLWNNVAETVEYIRQLDYPVFAFEEPLQPNQHKELGELAAITGVPVILDESFLRAEQLNHLDAHSDHWLINLRVSKMGGLIRSLRVIEKARNRGVRLIVGAQVGETSLLTRAALTVAHQARDILMSQEGAFGTFLLKHDLWEPPLMFGAGGILDIDSMPCAGFGLRLSADTNCLHLMS